MHENLTETNFREGERLFSRIDILKTHVLSAERLSDEDGAKWSFLSKESRGSAIVYVMAELESLVSTVIRNVHGELSHCAIPLSQLRPCLRPLAAHSLFESLRATGKTIDAWRTRGVATNLETSADTASFPVVRNGAQPPLDGRTLKPEHFRIIWEVYGLPGEPFPTISWATTLQKLSGLRNDLAHGNVPFGEVFQTAGVRALDVERYLTEMQLLALHFLSAWESFMHNESYRLRGSQ